MLSSRLAAVILSAKWTATLNRGGYAGWTLNLPLGMYAVFADAPEQPRARDELDQPELLASVQLHVRRLGEPLNIPGPLLTEDVWAALREVYWAALARTEAGEKLSAALERH